MLRADLGWLCAAEGKLWAKRAQRWTRVSSKRWGGLSGSKVGRGLNSFMEGAVSGAGDETSSVIIHWKQEDDTDIFLDEAD